MGPRAGRPSQTPSRPGNDGKAGHRRYRVTLICVAAAVTVWSMRTAIAIGPTPPGTGVIIEARSTAES